MIENELYTEDPLIQFRRFLLSDDLEVQLETLKKLECLTDALDDEQKKEDLLPMLHALIDDAYCHDEVLFTLSDQLINVITIIGGPENIHMMFDIFEKLACVDDNIIRSKTISSFIYIAANLPEEEIVNDVLPFINKLATHESFSGRCSAAAMFSIFYPKVQNVEQREQLRKSFISLCQDDEQFVRKSCALNMEEFVNNLELSAVEEFVPVFVDLAGDMQEDVRCCSIAGGLAIAEKLTHEEVKDLLLETFIELWRDQSWKVKKECLTHTAHFLEVIGPEASGEHLVSIFSHHLSDKDMPVRKAATSQIASFCKYVQNNFESEKSSFVITKMFLPAIQDLSQDICEEVREEILFVLTDLVILLGSEAVKTHVVPILYGIINSEYSINEYLVMAFNQMLEVVDKMHLTSAAEKFIKDLLENPRVSWRARRTVTVTLGHLIILSDSQFCEKYICPNFIKLLKDECFSVRRTSVLILPLLMKQCGPTWSKHFLKESIFSLAENSHYLLRILCLNCIDEILLPSLDSSLKNASDYSLLHNIKDALNDESKVIRSARILCVIDNKLKDVIDILQKDWAKLQSIPEQRNDILFYAQDTLIELEKDFCGDMLCVTNKEIDNDLDRSYLEGIFAVLPEIVKVIRFLKSDKVDNVKQKALITLKLIHDFVERIEKEMKQPWVEEAIGKLPEDDEIFEVIARRARYCSIESSIGTASCDSISNTNTFSPRKPEPEEHTNNDNIPTITVFNFKLQENNVNEKEHTNTISEENVENEEEICGDAIKEDDVIFNELSENKEMNEVDDMLKEINKSVDDLQIASNFKLASKDDVEETACPSYADVSQENSVKNQESTLVKEVQLPHEQKEPDIITDL